MNIAGPSFHISDEYLMCDLCNGTAQYYNDYMKTGSYKSIETGHVEDRDKKPISLEELKRVWDLVTRYLTQVGRLIHKYPKLHLQELEACFHDDTQGLSITGSVPNPFFVRCCYTAFCPSTHSP